MHDITLLQLFNDDIGISQQLLELIQDEFKALGERDLPQLEQILGHQHAQNVVLITFINRVSRMADLNYFFKYFFMSNMNPVKSA